LIRRGERKSAVASMRSIPAVSSSFLGRRRAAVFDLDSSGRYRDPAIDPKTQK